MAIIKDKTGTGLSEKMGKIDPGYGGINLPPSTADEGLEDYKKRIGMKYLTEPQYKYFIGPKIAQRVKEYKEGGMDERTALAELNDEFGYKDMINEAWYGRPRRSDIEVWKDRAKKIYDMDPDNEWNYYIGKYGLEGPDEWIQKLIDVFGFNRGDEW